MSDLEKQADLLFQNVAGWEERTMRRIGHRIKTIGKMSAEDAKALNNIAIVKKDMNAITKDLASVTGENIRDVQTIYGNLLRQQHLLNKPLYDYRKMQFVSIEENKQLQAIVNAYSKITGGEMLNLSKTSGLRILDESRHVLPLEQGYQNVLDKAVMNVATGTTDFNTAMSDAIEALGGNGVFVEYASGYTRRLDSAVRQSMLWGAKQASNQYNEMIGDELGCDGIEIDWHSNPRPSHADFQGKQYIIGKAQTINGIYYESADEALSLLDDYGCLHYKTPIICGVSTPRFSESELQRLNEENEQTYEIDGVEMSGYEAKQAMRKLETEVRKQESIKNMAEASGEEDIVKKCNKKIAAYKAKYNQISKKTGIKKDYNRLNIVK